jgi:AraC-like DNA-binding protein
MPVNKEIFPGLAPGIDLLAALHPYVRHCGDPRRPAWQLGFRRLLDYLLVYIAEGRGEFIVGETSYQAQPGDLFWIPPDTPHSMEGYAPSMVCPYVHFDLIYRPGKSHWDFSIPVGMLEFGELQPLLHPPVDVPALRALCGRIRAHNNERVGELIREICREAARAHPYAQLRMSGLMLEIVAELLRGQSGAATEAGSAHLPQLEEAADYLRQHCQEDVSVEDAAELAGLSPSRFRELFSRHFGRPPREYLRHARIMRAKQLMVGSDLTLSQIAGRVGFSTVHSFSRAFKEAEGIAPSEYRRCGGEVYTRVEGRATPYSR